LEFLKAAKSRCTVPLHLSGQEETHLRFRSGTTFSRSDPINRSLTRFAWQVLSIIAADRNKQAFQDAGLTALHRSDLPAFVTTARHV
jgi:hypothetical protein